MISWIKLDINILDDAKIKIIRSHPDGDSVALLWIGLLCLAMKSSRPGTIEISDGLPYTVDDLSSLFNIEKKTVEMGLALFSKYRMIEVFEGGSIDVINFSKHQKIEEIERKRDLTRARVERYRDKTRNCNALLTHNSVTVTLTDKDKDLDLDKDKDLEKKKRIPAPAKIKYLDSVLLTSEEYQKLILKYGHDPTEKAIEILNNAIMSKGYKYKSHYHTLLGWPMQEAQNGTSCRSRNNGGTRTATQKTGGARSDDEPYPVDVVCTE